MKPREAARGAGPLRQQDIGRSGRNRGEAEPLLAAPQGPGLKGQSLGPTEAETESPSLLV